MRQQQQNKSRGLWRRGNAVLEAALVVPILLGLSAGTVEIGHFFFIKHTMQGAARDGTRTAILPSATNSTVTEAVNRTMNAAGIVNTGTPPKYVVEILKVNPAPPYAETLVADISKETAGTAIKVKVTCTWSNVGIRPMNLLAANKQVVGFTIMVKE